jgi:hypothetical protein
VKTGGVGFAHDHHSVQHCDVFWCDGLYSLHREGTGQSLPENVCKKEDT